MFSDSRYTVWCHSGGLEHIGAYSSVVERSRAHSSVLEHIRECSDCSRPSRPQWNLRSTDTNLSDGTYFPPRCHVLLTSVACTVAAWLFVCIVSILRFPQNRFLKFHSTQTGNCPHVHAKRKFFRRTGEWAIFSPRS